MCERCKNARRVPELVGRVCPNCQFVLPPETFIFPESLEQLKRNDRAGPSVGDFALCPECGLPMKFAGTAGLLSLTLVTREDVAGMSFAQMYEMAAAGMAIRIQKKMRDELTALLKKPEGP
jgi:hypothetical protein